MPVITELPAQRITIETIETASLGDRSYLATDGDVAVVVDPQRDIDRIHPLAAEHGVRVTHVVETHVHNDYLSGGLELAERTGATYVLPADSRVHFPHLGAHDGGTAAPATEPRLPHPCWNGPVARSCWSTTTIALCDQPRRVISPCACSLPRSAAGPP